MSDISDRKNFATAKVFMSGRSQAVRLPKAFRFDTDEVTVERAGSALILRPKQSQEDWWAEMQAVLGAFEGMDFIERDRTPPTDDLEPF
ncbi:MAG: type II toxin-antitoxin system VapB family antitoxin [Variovorax sp.]